MTTIKVGVEVTEDIERNERNYMKEEQERAFQEAQIADQVNYQAPKIDRTEHVDLKTRTQSKQH